MFENFRFDRNKCLFVAKIDDYEPAYIWIAGTARRITLERGIEPFWGDLYHGYPNYQQIRKDRASIDMEVFGSEWRHGPPPSDWDKDVRELPLEVKQLPTEPKRLKP